MWLIHFFFFFFYVSLIYTPMKAPQKKTMQPPLTPTIECPHPPYGPYILLPKFTNSFWGWGEGFWKHVPSPCLSYPAKGTVTISPTAEDEDSPQRRKNRHWGRRMFCECKVPLAPCTRKDFLYFSENSFHRLHLGFRHHHNHGAQPLEGNP